jgi:xanthine dehydrogenase accessory factor
MNATRVLEIAARAQAEGQPCALVTVLRAESPTSARPGDKAVVMKDGTIRGWVGGGCAQPAVVKTVRAALADGRPRMIRITPGSQGQRDLADVLEFGMACHSGGTLELFVDPLLPTQQLVVIGTSPVAVALAQLGPRVGFDVVVAGRGAEPADYPDARTVVEDDGVDALRSVVSEGAYVVVATQGRRDLAGLKAALSLKAAQVSFVASARKAAVLRESLLGAGFDPDEVAAIVAPAGYPISAGTPEEIALSVLAAVVAERRGRSAEARQAPATGASEARSAESATATSNACCGSTSAGKAPEPASTEPVTQKRGSCCGE